MIQHQYVEFADKKLEIPVVPNYRYLPAGNAGIISFADQSSPVILASFYKDFSTNQGIATKTVNPDKSFYWTPADGVKFPLDVKITLARPNGYAEEFEIYNMFNRELSVKEIEKHGPFSILSQIKSYSDICEITIFYKIYLLLLRWHFTITLKVLGTEE